MTDTSSNSAPRLRAVVRASLSPGVWLAIGAQLLLLLFLRASGELGPEPAAWRFPAVILLFLGFMYLVAGVSEAMARSRDTIGAVEALRAGGGVYGAFLWLALKAAAVSFLLLNLGFSVLLALSGREVQDVFEESLGAFPWVGAAIAFLFVYWMPIVFVQHRFALFDSLRAALATLGRDRADWGFLAVLTLTPTVVAMLLGEAPPFYLVVVLNAVGSWMGWTAYAYCAERVGSVSPAPVS